MRRIRGDAVRLRQFGRPDKPDFTSRVQYHDHHRHLFEWRAAIAGSGHGVDVVFQATVLPAQPSVYVVDVNSAPAGCLTTWTAVSADTAAVQLSPANGTGRSQVELFRPGDNA